MDNLLNFVMNIEQCRQQAFDNCEIFLSLYGSGMQNVSHFSIVRTLIYLCVRGRNSRGKNISAAIKLRTLNYFSSNFKCNESLSLGGN